MIGFVLLCNISSSSAQVDTAQRVTPGRSNSPQQAGKSCLVLISGDGFSYDYAQKYQAKNLLRLSANGVRAQSMIPSFPSVTHPNHLALVTGLYPSHSGIVGNDFYDPALKAHYKQKDGRFFPEEPVWITAEKQQMLTANFFWVSGSTEISGMLPSYYYVFSPNKDVSEAARIRAFAGWLSLPEAQRPHLITMYFPDTDHAGHEHGPDAPETRAAVQFIDAMVGRLDSVARASGLPVNFIFVSTLR